MSDNNEMNMNAPSISIPTINLPKLNPILDLNKPMQNVAIFPLNDHTLPTIKFVKNLLRLIKELDLNQVIFCNQNYITINKHKKIWDKFFNELDYNQIRKNLNKDNLKILYIESFYNEQFNYGPETLEQRQLMFSSLSNLTNVNGADISKLTTSKIYPFLDEVKEFFTNIENLYIIYGVNKYSTDYKLVTQGVYHQFKTHNYKIIVDYISRSVFGDYLNCGYLSFYSSVIDKCRMAFYNSDFIIDESIFIESNDILNIKSIFPYFFSKDEIEYIMSLNEVYQPIDLTVAWQ
jgi:hypothetical protein